MRSGSTVIDVVEVEAGTWDVREPGSTRPLPSWFSRKQAVREASTMLRDGLGGTVRIIVAAGGRETIDVPSGKRPWWQVMGSPRTAYLLGGLWLMITGVQIVTGILDQEPVRPLTVIMMLAGLAIVASGVVQHRQSRH